MRRTQHEQRMYGEQYQRVRLLALARDGNRCQCCYSANDLEAHHKPMAYPRYESDEQLLADLITLCHSCHDAITNERRRKRNSVRANRKTYLGTAPRIIPSHQPIERQKIDPISLLGNSSAQAAHNAAFKTRKE